MSAGRIETPRDLDAAARALNEALRTQTSPQRQLHALVGFHERTAHLPLTWRKTYFLPHSRALLRLILHPYTTGHSPGLWRTAMRFLDDVHEASSDSPEYADARAELLCKATLAFAYLGDYRQLHAFLQDAGVPMRKADELSWSEVYGAGPDAFAMFVAYRAAEAPPEDPHHPLNAALLRWSAWRSHDDAASVVLLEEGAHETIAGAVLRMEISTRRGSGAVHINNVLGADADMTREQLLGARQLAAGHAESQLGHRFEGRDAYFQIIDLHAAFSGGSLGLAATVGLACHLSGQVNARLRWTLPADTACIASLDASGRLESVAWETIRRKIDLAFFSPLRRIVIPAGHIEAATRRVQELQREYPQRSFEVLAAATFRDCFRPGHAVETITRNPYDRLQAFGRQHARTGMLLVAMLVLAAATWMLYRSYVMFPDLEATQGIQVPENAIVYNPHDALTWAFRDGRTVIDPVLANGDLEVGDGFSRVFRVYNMTPRPFEVCISVEGGDEGQWYINDGGGVQRLEAATPRRLSVMYAPTEASRRHRAALLFRDGPNGRELFRIELQGTAGRSETGGYALRLDGRSQYLSWGRQALAFTHGNLTIEAWVRSLGWNGCFLHNGADMPGNADRPNLTLDFRDGIPQLSVGDEHITVPLETPLKPQEWYHIALSYAINPPVLRFFLDGRMLLEWRVPLSMPARMAPYVNLGASADSSSAGSFLECEVDNFRVWWELQDEATVRRNMRNTSSGGTPGLKANFTMETWSDETAFNTGGDSPDAVLLGRPAFVRSTAPIAPDVSLPVIGPGPHDLPGLTLVPGSWLRFSRQLLPRHGDATFACWWHTDVGRGTAFVVQNLGRCISLSADTVATLYSGCRRDVLGRVTPGWHHLAVRVLRDGRKEVFIDGVQRATVEPCMPAEAEFDWHAGYEGITFGLYDDTYTALSASQEQNVREALSRTRRIAEICVWKRLLSNEEMVLLARGEDPPPDHLVAWWRFDRSMTAELNFIDRVAKQPLHVRKAGGYR